VTFLAASLPRIEPMLTSRQAYVDPHGARAAKFPPGRGFEYSNYGFVLLGRVIERASRQSDYDYLREHIFEPAGMSHTGSRPESEAVEGRAVGYRWAPQGTVSNADTLPPMGTAAGGGYIHDGRPAALRPRAPAAAPALG
jgi:D-alanyl-D-alanine carboxypeptidase